MLEKPINDEQNLIPLFNQILNYSSENPKELLKEIKNQINNETAPSILGFINHLYTVEIDLDEDSRDEFQEIAGEIIAILCQKLDKKLSNLIPKEPLTFTANKKSNNGNPFDKFINLALETLIKKTQHEIINNFNVEFNREISSNINYAFTSLDYLKFCTNEESVQIVKEIVYFVTEDQIEAILDFFEQNNTFFDIFLLALKFSKADILNSIYDLIYSSKKYLKKSFISAMPEVDFDKIIPIVREYNWEILSILIDKRPEIISKICTYFNENSLNVSRQAFLEKVIEQDYLFCYYIDDLPFNQIEFLQICTKSKIFSNFYVLKVKDEEEMIEFCKTILKKDQRYIIEFIEKIRNEACLVLFLVCLCKTMRFADLLKSYLIENFADHKEFFHYLIFYIDSEKTEELLKKYYTKSISVDKLLKKMNPQELIIEINKYQDFNLGSKLIEDCFENSKFHDNDWLLAMKYLESVNTPIKFRMCYLIFQIRPNLKSYAISCIKRSINDTVWNDKISCTGIIRCLEFLKEDSIPILEVMNRSEVGFLFGRSQEIEKNVRRFFENYKGPFSQSLEFIESCLKH